MADVLCPIFPSTTTLFRFNGCPRTPRIASVRKAKEDFTKIQAPTLTFFASFDNRGHPPEDKMQFRDCKILYFVEDGTIRVFEPKIMNSGLMQGTIISRSKIPSSEGCYYTLDDLNIGRTLVIYGKSFKIYDCDQFTRRFLTEMGYRVGVSEARPMDPVLADRLQEDTPKPGISVLREKVLKGLNFLKHFPKVLHFYGIYQRNPEHMEDRKYVSLYYSLSDNTIKIMDDTLLLEQKQYHDSYIHANCVILKPTILPKKHDSLNVSEPKRTLNLVEANRMILKALGVTDPSITQKNGKVESLKYPCEVETLGSYYSTKDLGLGITIPIFGARVFLYDCDEFTKQYYKCELGRELKPVELPKPVLGQNHKMICQQEMGSFSNTLLSVCKDLKPVEVKWKPPPALGEEASEFKRSSNLLKFYMNGRDGLDGKILRFLARNLTNNDVKKLCVYCVNYYLEDDTLDIREYDPGQTSQLKGGSVVLSRMRVVKPNANYTNAGECMYNIRDLFVGNVICLKMKLYYIFDADEYTYSYMEKHGDIFPFSNFNKVLLEFRNMLQDKIDKIKNAFKSEDKFETSFVNYDTFKQIISKYSSKNQCRPEQELMTLARQFSDEKNVGFKLNDLVSKVQDQLRRNQFQDFSSLRTQFKIFDRNYGKRTGRMVPYQVYRILISCPLPVSRDLLKAFVYQLPMFEGMLDYEVVVQYLDYLKCPTESPDQTPYAININWERVETLKNVDKINYVSFLKKITGG